MVLWGVLYVRCYSPFDVVVVFFGLVGVWREIFRCGAEVLVSGLVFEFNPEFGYSRYVVGVYGGARFGFNVLYCVFPVVVYQ